MIRMPWSEAFSPNIGLEINSKCNISCRGCYKKLDGTTKPMKQIIDELDFALSRRKIQTVSIVGGEPTLHPQLCEIIGNIHKRNIRTAMLTNGLELDDSLLSKLKTAGLDIIMLHIDQEQKRPDLPEEPSTEDVNSLIADLSSKIAKKGINAGLTLPIHNPNSEEAVHITDRIIRSEHINLLLAINYIDTNCFDKTLGLDREDNRGIDHDFQSKRNSQIAEKLESQFGLQPYAYLPADQQEQWGDGNWPWMLYFIPVIYTKNGHYYFRIKSNLADKMLLNLIHFIGGRPIFYSGQNQAITYLRVLLNAVTGFRFVEGAKFLGKAFHSQARIRSKGLIFENGPILNDNGELSCCEFCTNATVRNGQLVPICVADHAFKEER